MRSLSVFSEGKGRSRVVSNPSILKGRTITIPDERPMSWNTLYSGQHWTVRKEQADRVHLVVRQHINPNHKPFKRKVDIVITVYFKNRPLDPCNITAKMYIDGLIGWWLVDDNPKYVRSVKTVSLVDKDNPRVVIEAVEVEDGE